MLEPYRVVDLTNELGILCGQILADLGADVIAVEPPGGSSARRVGPWLKDEPGPERSLFWAAYARNKRSVVLDLDSADGREAFVRLLEGADFFVESEPPGRLAALGLDRAELERLNPGLVHVSITPFGQDGPKADWAATDLTLAGAAGTLYLSGQADKPPVRVQTPQAHAHAATDGAVGALIAHFARRRTGRGQHVDVSAQQSLTLATMFRILDEPLGQTPARRIAGGIQVGRAWLPNRYPLLDGGWVVLGPAVLASTGHFAKRLLTWVAEEGFCEPEFADWEWGSFALRLLRDEIPADSYAPVEDALRRFFASKNKSELMQAAVERKLLIAPMLDLDEIVESPQLAEREFPVPVEHPVAGRVRVPGPFARFERSPISYRHASPTLDADGDTIRTEARRRPAQLESARSTGASARSTGASARATGASARATGASARASGVSADEADGALPLDGVKVLDLFWVLAGPGATRMLADYGASVVHVESTRHLDTLRVIPPYQFSEPHPEGAAAFQCANANKLGITLDLARPEAREVVLDLVRWADVVTESFAPGVIGSYGFDYASLCKVKPDLIMLSSCLMGQTGPWRDFTGFGNLAATVTGFQQLASWPGEPPAGPFGAYTDFIAVRYNALAILAALEHRERTGQGQHIDQSQAEAALHFLGPLFLDYTANARVPRAIGNEDADLFPHGVFPTRGEDRWIAIAIQAESDEAWRALCEVMGRPDLEPHRNDRARVVEAIEQWTSDRDGAELEARLQARGVPAHVALDTPGLWADAQLQHREHFLEIEHDIYPTTTIESSRLRLSSSTARRPERAVSFGRDNRRVLETLLGYTPERIAELAEQGILV